MNLVLQLSTISIKGTITHKIERTHGRISLPQLFVCNIREIRKLILTTLDNYRIVASSSPSRIEAHAGLFRMLMKGIFDPYVLRPFDKKLIF